MALSILPLLISITSLIASLYLLWTTHLRQGRLRMIRPMLIFIGREGAKLVPKVYFRAILFCTAERGCIIESMYLKVTNDAGTYLFDFWAFGESKLVPGGGLSVPKTGVALNHHFVHRRTHPAFAFCSGNYRFEVFAKVLGHNKVIKLAELDTAMTGDQGPTMMQVMDAGVFFEWDTAEQQYVGRVERRSERRAPPDFLDSHEE